MNKLKIYALSALLFSFVACSSGNKNATTVKPEDVCKKTVTSGTVDPATLEAKDFYFYAAPILILSNDGDHLLGHHWTSQSNFSVWSLSQKKGLALYHTANQYKAVAKTIGNRSTVLRGTPEYASISHDGRYVAFSFGGNTNSCTDLYKGHQLVASLSGYGVGFTKDKLVLAGNGSLSLVDLTSGTAGPNILKGSLLPRLPALFNRQGETDSSKGISSDSRYFYHSSVGLNGDKHFLTIETVDLTSGVFAKYEVELPGLENDFYRKFKVSTLYKGELIGDEYRGIIQYHVDNRVFATWFVGYDFKTKERSSAPVPVIGKEAKYTGNLIFAFDRTLQVLDNSVQVLDSKTGKVLERKELPDNAPVINKTGSNPVFTALKGNKGYIKTLPWNFGNAYDAVSLIDLSGEKVVGSMPFQVTKVYKPDPEPVAKTPNTSGPQDKQTAFIQFIHKYGPNPSSLSEFNYDVGVYCQYKGPRCHEYRVMYQKMERDFNARAEAANMKRIWDYTSAVRPAGVSSEARSRCLQKLTESINRHTYGKQDWHFDLNMCN